MESATTTRSSAPRGPRREHAGRGLPDDGRRPTPDRPAIRTKDDEFTCTWGEYAAKVESVARGLAALGLGAGDTIGLMLTNRPEFHFVDSAALHLGATPFSIYNTYTAEQIEYLVGDAANKILVTENAFLPIIKQVEGARDDRRGRRRRRRTARSRSTTSRPRATPTSTSRARGRP